MECPYLEGVRDRDKGSTLAAPLVLSYHGIPASSGGSIQANLGAMTWYRLAISETNSCNLVTNLK